MLSLPPYEHQYSPGKTDIYARGQDLHQGREKYKTAAHIGAKFAPLYEHQYSFGKTDIYVCEPQYYVGKTYIRRGGKDKNGGISVLGLPPL